MSDEKPKLLAVDDERDNLDLIKRALRKEFDVLAVTSAIDALKLLEHNDFAVILSDQRMPDMTGTEFLAKSLERQPSAIRMLITGYSDIEAVIDAINKGSVHRFIKKPWRKEELLREIENIQKLLTLTVENQEMVVKLKKANEELLAQKHLLSQSLDERSRELFLANEELKKYTSHLEGQTTKDGLTNLYNQKAFRQRLNEEALRSLRNKTKISVIFIDVDHFKNYNDTNGHPAGDLLLKQLADLLSNSSRNLSSASHVRQSDIVARYGGEEFALILPDTPLEGARIKAERIRKAILEETFFGMEKQPMGRITASLGIATLPDHAQTPDKLVEHADQAMYLAKKTGRNQVKTFEDVQIRDGSKEEIKS